MVVGGWVSAMDVVQDPREQQPQKFFLNHWTEWSTYLPNQLLHSNNRDLVQFLFVNLDLFVCLCVVDFGICFLKKV